jgi:hypothetical protein
VFTHPKLMTVWDGPSLYPPRPTRRCPMSCSCLSLRWTGK